MRKTARKEIMKLAEWWNPYRCSSCEICWS